MSKLKESGIIGSVAGARGGFFLNKKPDEITLWQIYVAVKEGELFFKHKPNDDCPVGGNLCELVDSVYREAESSMEHVLGRITVRNLHQNLNMALA